MPEAEGGTFNEHRSAWHDQSSIKKPRLSFLEIQPNTELEKDKA